MTAARYGALAAALVLGACATGPSERNWTSGPGAQPFATAVSACQESSYGIETNFVTCMTGRGWIRRAR